MTKTGAYILTHSLCSSCIWSREGFYNKMCAHCVYATYSKDPSPNYISEATAKQWGIIKEERQ